jgi:hypothetical protein
VSSLALKANSQPRAIARKPLCFLWCEVNGGQIL